ncbi:MAG: hypothetical protein ACYTBJ_09365 [Planctomycetota bacterium]|jgi:hypothetical protein
MDEGQTKQQNLLDTTDCLEAIGVFGGWKNFLFAAVICCMLVLQVLFWVANMGLVKVDNQGMSQPEADLPVAEDKDNEPIEDVGTVKIELTEDANEIQKAAEQVAADSNVPAEAPPKKARRLPEITFQHLGAVIRFLNFVLILAAVLYCLTMLFSLKISLLGRLGGINHISRAFFLSLLLLVLIVPWQRFFFFADILAGVIYTPEELKGWIEWYYARDSRILAAIPYYVRFTGYWALAMLFLVFSLLRSTRWTKATHRRLEIV